MDQEARRRGKSKIMEGRYKKRSPGKDSFCLSVCLSVFLSICLPAMSVGQIAYPYQIYEKIHEKIRSFAGQIAIIKPVINDNKFGQLIDASFRPIFST